MIKRIVTYDEYDSLMFRLARMLRSDERLKKINTVYGIPRGGLPIAVHLSHVMNWSFTIHPFQSHVEHTIIVDDIADTGLTLRKFGVIYATATLFYKPRSDIKPNFYVEETDKWIVFPWEKDDEIPNRPT